MNRRNFISLSSLTLATPLMAEYWNIDWSVHHPNDFSIERAIHEITKGKKINHTKKIQLITPEISENAAVVPIKVKVDSPMLHNNHIKSIYIFTDNANSRAIYVDLTPKNGKAYFASRVKLTSIGWSKVIALIQDSNDNFFIQKSMVRVLAPRNCCG